MRVTMVYVLQRLAAGSYDLELNGEVIGSVVRAPVGDHVSWHAELLATDPAAPKPAPFEAAEHAFGTFDEVVRWLEHPEVRNASHP